MSRLFSTCGCMSVGFICLILTFVFIFSNAHIEEDLETYFHKSQDSPLQEQRTPWSAACFSPSLFSNKESRMWFSTRDVEWLPFISAIGVVSPFNSYYIVISCKGSVESLLLRKLTSPLHIKHH